MMSFWVNYPFNGNVWTPNMVKWWTELCNRGDISALDLKMSNNLSLGSSLTSRGCLEVILKSRSHMRSLLSHWPHTNLQFHVSDTLSLISIQHGPARFPIAPTKKTKQFQKELQDYYDKAARHKNEPNVSKSCGRGWKTRYCLDSTKPHSFFSYC